jgi:hypothetical protein
MVSMAGGDLHLLERQQQKPPSNQISMYLV